MANEKKRILYLFYILSQQIDYICSFELAEIVGVTMRTVKNDIKDLELYAETSGAKLVTKKGSGYKLEIVDSELYETVTKQLEFRVASIGNMNSKESQHRTNEILRRIIVEDKFLTVDDIASELYLTKSSIKDEMKEVQQMLKMYNLSFRKRGEEGPLIKGTEFDRRMMMICLFEVYYHEAKTLFQSNDYLRYFMRPDEERFEIRHIFLEKLRNSQCHVGDDYTQRLSRYLCLLSSRYQAGYKINFSKKQIMWIQEFQQYKVAEEVLKELKQFSGFDVNIDEVAAFALLLIFWADISPESDLEKQYGSLYVEAREFIKKLDVIYKEDYGINITELEDYENVLCSSLIPILMQKHFNASQYTVNAINTIDESRVRNSSFCIKLAREAYDLFKKEYDSSISLPNLIVISESLELLFYKISYKFKPIRLIVSMLKGLKTANAVANIIENKLGTYFERIEYCEFYEIRKLKVEDYDYVVMNFPFYSYKYEWPCLRIDSIPTQSQIQEIYNTIILKGVQLQEPLTIYNLNEINVYEKFDYHDLNTFINLISFKMCKNSSMISELANDLLQNSYTCCFNKVCILIVKKKYVNTNYFDVYKLKKNGHWRANEIEHIIVISIDCGFSLEVTRFINNLCFQLLRDIKYINSICENPCNETLVNIVRESLEILPFALTKGK